MRVIPKVPADEAIKFFCSCVIAVALMNIIINIVAPRDFGNAFVHFGMTIPAAVGTALNSLSILLIVNQQLKRRKN